MKNITAFLIAANLSMELAAIEIIDRVAIIVGEGVVLESQVDSMLKTIKSRINQQGIEMPPDDLLLEQVKERLIVEELQLQMGKRAGVRISDGELNVAIENIASSNNLSLDEFVSNFDETRNITSNSVLVESLTYLGSSLITQENLDQDYYDFILKLETAMQEISSGMRPQIVLSNLTINSGSNE